MVLAHEHPRQIVEHPPAPRPMMFWQSSFEHLARWPPRHRRGCQSRLSARTGRHYLPPLGLPRMIRLSVSLRPSRTWREFRIEADQPLPRFSGSRSPAPDLRSFNDVGIVRTLLCEPRRPQGFTFLRVHQRRWEKASEPLGVVAPAARLTSCLLRVDWPAQPYLNLAQRLFQQYFIKCFSRITCRLRAALHRVS